MSGTYRVKDRITPATPATSGTPPEYTVRNNATGAIWGPFPIHEARKKVDKLLAEGHPATLVLIT